MSRSLAFVGILAMMSAGGTWSAYGQETVDQAASGQVVNNHMSDAERDRLMEEAMESARLELEKKKAQERLDKQRTEEAKAQERQKNAAAAQADSTTAAADAERKAAAERKAREERLAAELAEAEKNAGAKQAEAKDLDRLEPINVYTSSENETATKASPAAKTSVEPAMSKTVTTKSEPKPAAKPASEKPASDKSVAKAKPADEPKSKPADEPKAVVKTVSTNQPGSGITVKTNMPVGDDERRAEQAAAAQGYAPQGANDRSGGGSDMSLSGHVVGIMHSGGGPPRILVNGDDNRMIQVIIEKAGAEIPAPGTFVSIKGRDVSGGAGRMVVSATSINGKNDSRQRAPMQAEPMMDVPQIAVAPPPGPMGPPMIAGPMPPMIGGGMPPPMPMMGGPMIMGGPPPMF